MAKIRATTLPTGKKKILSKPVAKTTRSRSKKKGAEILKLENKIKAMEEHLKKNKHDVQTRFLLAQLKNEYRIKVRVA